MSADPKEERAAMAAFLAALLPGRWTVDDTDSCWQARLTRPDGAHLYISAQRHGKADMWHVGASVPDGVREFRAYQQHEPSANVSKAKDAAAVARDIVRRILPGLDAMTVACAERAAERARDADTTATHVATLQAAAPYLRVRRGRDEERHPTQVAADFYAERDGASALYGDITVLCDGTVNLSMRGVPVALAAKLLAALRPLVKP